jgi:hypothetical protein
MMERYQHKAKLAFVILDDDGWIKIQICTKKNKAKLDCWIVNKQNKKMHAMHGGSLHKSANQQMIAVYLLLQPS